MIWRTYGHEISCCVDWEIVKIFKRGREWLRISCSISMANSAKFRFHDRIRMWNGEFKISGSGKCLLFCTLFYVSSLEIVVNATDVSGLRLRQLQQSCPGRSADPDTIVYSVSTPIKKNSWCDDASFYVLSLYFFSEIVCLVPNLMKVTMHTSSVADPWHFGTDPGGPKTYGSYTDHWYIYIILQR